MKKIITLTGHKYSGKVSLAMKLVKNADVDLIYPYTDKPFQLTANQYDSDNYHHISKEKLDLMIKNENLLSQTIIDGYRWCFFECQLTADYNIMIVDDYAVVNTKSNYKEVYSIKVWKDGEEKSDRVGKYLYDHDYDEVFHYGVDDADALEWRIGYGS